MRYALTATHRLNIDPYPRVHAVSLEGVASAHHWLNIMRRGMEPQRQGNTLLYPNGMKIESPQMDEILSHRHGMYDPPVHLDDRYYAQAERFHKARWHESPVEDSDAPSRSAPARAVKPQRPQRPEGYVTIGDLVDGTDLTPQEARAILRLTEKKPAYGWAWDKKELPRIRKLIGLKKS